MRAAVIALLSLALLVGFALGPGVTAEDIRNPLESLARGIDMEKNAKEVLDTDMPAVMIYNWLSTQPRMAKPEDHGWMWGSVDIEKDYSLDFGCYVPDTYDPAKPTPVLIMLHGGVSLPEPIGPNPLQQYSTLYRDLLDTVDTPYFLVVPQGSARSPWWSANWLTMFKGIMRDLRSKLNVDTDRVLVTGFSDGGSGSYYMAAVEPTLVAEVWPFNGMVAVASMGGDEVSIHKMRNRPIFACNTTEDQLYPPPAYRPFMEQMKAAGVKLEFREFENIGHTPGYFDQIKETAVSRFKAMRRDAWGNELHWSTLDMKHPRVDWLTILEVGKTESTAEFLPHSVKMKGRLMLGISVDDQYEGPGVRVADVSDDTPASAAGMLAGDVIIRMNGMDIASFADLRKMLGAMEEKEDFTIVVQRDGAEVELKGNMGVVPEREYLAPPDGAGQISVTLTGNTFEVKCVNVKRFQIAVRPGFVDLQAPVRVIVNGQVAFEEVPKLDREFIVKSFLRDYDPSLVPIGKVEVEVK